MKKLAILSALVTSASLFAASAYADGTVTVTGSVADLPCSVTLPTSIDLGEVSKSSYPVKGSVGETQPLDVQLTDCPTSVKNALVKFSGTTIADGTAMALQGGTGVATGIALQVVNNGLIVAPGSSSVKPITAGSNTLTYGVRYVATGDAVTSGKANSAVNVSVTYN